jgi:hypothetical protein
VFVDRQIVLVVNAAASQTNRPGDGQAGEFFASRHDRTGRFSNDT